MIRLRVLSAPKSDRTAGKDSLVTVKVLQACQNFHLDNGLRVLA